MRRVVVTGLGAVTALGVGESFFLLNGAGYVFLSSALGSERTAVFNLFVFGKSDPLMKLYSMWREIMEVLPS